VLRIRYRIVKPIRRTPPEENRWVAIVDDDPSVRSALARVLRTAGLTVETYATAHEYLSASTDREPSCLVLDVHLGGMTGFDLHDRLIAQGSHVHVVFITAHDEVSSEELERRAGPDGFLRKPFDGDQLLALVRRILRSATAR
jgi:FixJ family two-component response regulator